MNNKQVVAIVGSTGDIMQNAVFDLAKKNYDFIFINRSISKTMELVNQVLMINPETNIEMVECDLSNILSVKKAANQLLTIHFDYLILAGAILNDEKIKLELGYSKILTVNFISQYYLAKKLASNKRFKTIVVSSLSYKWNKIDMNDIDFSSRKKNTVIYGNSKRYLTISLMEELDNLVICHPGIVKTKMTTNYHKLVRPFIKFFMTILFPSPKKACRNITLSLDLEPEKNTMFGPKVFNIWGKPKNKQIKDVKDYERDFVKQIANEIYLEIEKS